MDISQLRRYWPAALAALIGIAASLAAFQNLRRSAEDNFAIALTAQAETRARGLQQVLSRYEGTIQAFAASFPYAQVNREQFHTYAQNVFLASHFLRSGLQSLSWLPRVPDADRERFEAAARIEGFRGYGIVEPALDGTFKTAAKQKDYYPIRYVEPIEAASPSGLDVLSEGTRASAVRRALEKGTASATAPLHYFAGGRGSLVYVPVFKSAATAGPMPTEDNHPVGVLAFRLFISPTIDAIVEALEPLPQGLDMYVLDDGAPVGDRMIYFRPQRKSNLPEQLPNESDALAEPFFGSSFNFAGRDWTVIVRPTVELRAGMLARAGWYELVLGLALTTLVVAYLVGSRNRAERLRVLNANLQQEVVERKRAEQMTTHSARHDFLTSLPNRMMFLDRLKQEIGRVKRGDNTFAVLFLDLDDFKDINDSLGHQTGDQLLVAIAERLTQSVREVDTVARLGGDEFAVIQTGLRDPADAAILATKLIAVLSSSFNLDGREVHTAVSVGTAIFTPDAANEQTILRQADLAMYMAKGLGGGRYCFYLPEMDEEIHARTALVEDLRGGIKRGELVLYYQPQVNRIKIAQVFVSRLPADTNSAAIVETITYLAAALHISLIAEGVETKEQLQFLRARGCAEAQGYYFSRPVPREATTALIRRGAFKIAFGGALWPAGVRGNRPPLREVEPRRSGAT